MGKETFLQPWEKSSYFRRTRHCVELQPRNSPWFPSSSFSPSLFTCCSETVFIFHVALKRGHFIEKQEEHRAGFILLLLMHRATCLQQTEQKHDGSSAQLVEQLSSDQGCCENVSEVWSWIGCSVTLQRLFLVAFPFTGGWNDGQMEGGGFVSHRYSFGPNHE